jgi:hypothetical protein
MKALTLTQPWASLVAVGAKRIETRSWSTRHRGPLAIHAGMTLPRSALALCDRSPFREALVKGLGACPVLPLGAVVATAELAEVMRTTDPRLRARLSEQELAFGDFTPGRYAWLLAGVRPLPEPIAARGALGLWQWHDAPAELAGSVG